MQTPENLKYSNEHEWVREDKDGCTIGITDYAQQELGDVVFVELPEVGRELTKGQPFGVVESVKAVSDVFAPIDGKIIARNEKAVASPDLVNKEPYAAGWLIMIEPKERSQVNSLLTAAQYSEYLTTISGA